MICPQGHENPGAKPEQFCVECGRPLSRPFGRSLDAKPQESVEFPSDGSIFVSKPKDDRLDWIRSHRNVIVVAGMLLLVVVIALSRGGGDKDALLEVAGPKDTEDQITVFCSAVDDFVNEGKELFALSNAMQAENRQELANAYREAGLAFYNAVADTAPPSIKKDIDYVYQFDDSSRLERVRELRAKSKRRVDTYIKRQCGVTDVFSR